MEKPRFPAGLTRSGMLQQWMDHISDNIDFKDREGRIVLLSQWGAMIWLRIAGRGAGENRQGSLHRGTRHRRPCRRTAGGGKRRARDGHRGKGNPDEFLQRLNRRLREVISREDEFEFITAFYLVIDTADGLTEMPCRADGLADLVGGVTSAVLSLSKATAFKDELCLVEIECGVTVG